MTYANATGRITIKDLKEMQRPSLGWYAEMAALTLAFMLCAGFPRLATTWVVRGMMSYNSIPALPDFPVTDQMTAAAIADTAMRDAGISSPVEGAIDNAASGDTFTLAMGQLMKSEGTNCNDPNGVDAADNGGLTCKGVTQATYNAAGHSGSVSSITQEQANEIYRKDYWQAVSHHPAPLAAALFNIAVNSGPGQADWVLDKLNAEGGSKLPPVEQALKALDIQQAYYQSLSDWSTYGAGWSNRTADWKALVQTIKTQSDKPVSDGSITPEVLDYFIEIATKNEFTEKDKLVRWETPVSIAIHGNPTPESVDTLKRVASELTQLTGRSVTITDDESASNVSVRFLPASEFSQNVKGYKSGSVGFFRNEWQNDAIAKSTVLISTEETQKSQNSIIREEITQAMGLTNDSFKYKDSIFQQAWTDVQEYSEIDKQIIALAYSPKLRSGMTAKQIKEALR